MGENVMLIALRGTVCPGRGLHCPCLSRSPRPSDPTTLRNPPLSPGWPLERAWVSVVHTAAGLLNARLRHSPPARMTCGNIGPQGIAIHRDPDYVPAAAAV